MTQQRSVVPNSNTPMDWWHNQTVFNPVSHIYTPLGWFKCCDALFVIRAVFDMPPLSSTQQLRAMGVAIHVEWNTGMTKGRFCGLDQLYRYLHARQSNGQRDVLMYVKNISKDTCHHDGTLIRAVVVVKRHGQCTPSTCICTLIISRASELVVVNMEWVEENAHRMMGVMSV